VQDADGERLGDLRRASALSPANRLGQSTQNLGEQDTRVASCAEERTARDRIAHPIDRRDTGGECCIALGNRRLQGGQHVGPGVPIGHREDVERIDLGNAGLEALGP
jgi:hypothetical protein